MIKGKVLVTGGCGYIGSHTILDLWENDFEIISIDNFSNSLPISIKLIEDIGGKKLVNYNIDVTDYRKTEKVFKSNDIIGVIHFAAFKSVPESVANPTLYYDNNMIGLLNILKLCQLYNIKNFVFSSSCSVYGDISELPVSESTNLGQQKSPYGTTKRMGEEIINDIAKSSNNDSNYILLRYFNPVGAHISCKIGELPLNKPSNLFPVVTGVGFGRFEKLTIFGNNFETRDGTCIRDFIHVSDIAHAHTLALEKMLMPSSKNICETINLGTGNGVSILETVNAFEEISEIKLNIELGIPREGDVVAIYADNKKAKEYLNWNPKYNLTQMMHTAWEWEKLKDNIILSC